MQMNRKALCTFLKGDKNDYKTYCQFTPIVNLPWVTLHLINNIIICTCTTCIRCNYITMQPEACKQVMIQFDVL